MKRQLFTTIFVIILAVIVLITCKQPQSFDIEDIPQTNGAFQVMFGVGEGHGTPPAIRKVEPDTVILLPGNGNMIAPQGSAFNGWKTGEFVYGATTPYTITENVTFTAQWKEIPVIQTSTFTVYYYDTAIETMNVYYWTLDGIHPAWPGTPMVKGNDGWWSGTVMNPLGIIFNNNNEQTIDLTRTISGCFVPTGTSIEGKITGIWLDEKPNPEDNAFTVYYYDSSASTMNVYYWTVDGIHPAWPGTPMVKGDDGWWSGTVTNPLGIIFNNGNSQTVDLTRTKIGYFFPSGIDAEEKITGTWHDTKPDMAENTFTVHYYEPVMAEMNVYYWTVDGIHPEWPGMPMVKGDDGWWSGTITNPLGIVFNNGNSQTVDLTRTKTGYFTPAGTSVEGKITGVWTDIKPEPDIPDPDIPEEQDNVFTVYYYDNTVRSMNVHYWMDSGSENSSWPGNPMTNLGDGWFSATVANNPAGIVFNDANQQTIDLTRTTTGYFLPEETNAEGKITGTWYNTRPATGPGEQSYYYPGTGKTYAGFRGTQGKHSTYYDEVTVTYPNETNFNADAFFTLEGRVKKAGSHNYAWVKVEKNGSPDLTTSYFVRGVFKTRIWLRFGPGAYTVTVIRLGEVQANSPDDNPNGGDISRWWYYISGNITFTVTNTRNDDGDARWLYPSAVVQSDNQTVTQLASSITAGLTSENDKTRAVHDYLIKNTIYDKGSLDDGKRRKQDALTVLGKRYQVDGRYSEGHFLAVCEGYANAAAALLRAAGIKAKYIRSTEMRHGWNNVYVNGAWKFMDVTWDDPVPDKGPSFTRYDYFLLNSLSGIRNDHYDYYDDARNVFPAVPGQEGMPDGWY